jgi:hypothetical protein
VLLVVGLAGALWSASGYIGAFMRASNVIWDVEEGRSAWKTVPLRLGITLLGAELDAELERGREMEHGMPADTEPFLPPRDLVR